MTVKKTAVTILGVVAGEVMAFSGLIPNPVMGALIHAVAAILLALLSLANLYVNPDGTSARCAYVPKGARVPERYK
jgi:hypothetical protein